MDIVKLKSSDFAIASDQLSAAFNQDPLIGYFLPEEASARLNALKRMAHALLNYGQPYNQIYTTAETPKGAAVWLPPDASQFTLSKGWQAVVSGLITVPFYIRWDRIGDLLSFVGTEIQLQNKNASEPHWHLTLLGVSPAYQGQGIGGKLLQPVLQEADRTKLPCYLETSTTSAVRFYQRHGFEIVYHGTFAGREYWAMKRSPQGG